MLLPPCPAVEQVSHGLGAIQPPSSSSSSSKQALPVSFRRHGAWLARHPAPERSPSVAASRSAGSGRQGRGGEEGREREIEALRGIHSKFIGAKLQSCMDLFPFGNYRKLQAPTTVIQIATLDD